MAIQVINIGTSANKGDGEPLRTAFDKINDNFSELSLKVTNLETGGVTVTTGDVKGSVFGDDSTLLVDGVNSKIPSANLSGALPAIDGSALTGLFSGAFADLTGKPTTIAGYGITDALQIGTSATTALAGNTTLFSGAYADLTGKPTLFSGAYADLTGLPSLFSGAYNDLTGKPTLFSGAYGDLTGAPTNISTFTNDSGYLTSVPAQTFVSLTDSPANFSGQAGKFLKVNVGETALEFGDAAYTDSDVDTHLNTGTAGSGEVLSWNGSDYDWVAQSGGGSQNLFRTIASNGQDNLVADSTIDTLSIQAGVGISIATDASTDTLTITATGLSDVVSDTTPQLGGALDLNNNNITGNGSINITGGATVSGNLVAGTGTVGGLTFAGTQIASDDSTQISFQDNIEIAGGPILSSTTLSHTGTFGISANTLNINAGSFGQVNIGTNQGTAPVVLGSSNNDTEVLCSGDLFIHSGIMHRHTSKTGATGTVDHDLDDGHVFMHSSMAADFTANLTNSHIGINTQTTVTFILTQGDPARMVTGLEIGGVNQTIRWAGNSTPSGTANGFDLVLFRIFQKTTGNYTVLGQRISHGGV